MRLDAFTPERLSDPQVRELMTRIELRLDPKLDAAFPRQRAANVEIETSDGKHYRHHAPTRKGDPDNPLTDDELTAKYRELATPVLGKATGEALLVQLWQLEQFGDLTTLTPAAQNASTAKAFA